MSERESMKLRDLKEAAYALYQRGRYAQCAETYAKLAKMLPRDANVRVRLAEACRRAGQKAEAITAYREASKILLSLGCESRARGALKAALELDPRDATLQLEVVRLGQGPMTPEALEEEELYRFDRLPPPTPPPARMRSVSPAPSSAPKEPVSPVVPSITPVCVRVPPLAMPAQGRQAVSPHSRPAIVMPAVGHTTKDRVSEVAGAARPPESAPVPKVIVSMFSFETRPAAGTARAPTGNTPPGIAPVTAGKAGTQKVLPKISPSALSPMPSPSWMSERPTVKVLALMNRAPEAQPTPPPTAPVPAARPPQAPALTEPPLPLLPFKPEMRRLSPNVVALRVSPQARWVIIRSESELEVSRSDELPDEFSATH